MGSCQIESYSDTVIHQQMVESAMESSCVFVSICNDEIIISMKASNNKSGGGSLQILVLSIKKK